ncbi:hypothetical protein Y032_0227g2814 [Ancylostoma ceylanicum]|uniref:Uncharacterized protein n=1 Tax=Ancylostoma ceylanicum TaxID=53326 RepID=A0A016SHF7_9BILA|nr:hypothetical protein Y032_0227g2814 [Ancylostoma ceylanicum]
MVMVGIRQEHTHLWRNERGFDNVAPLDVREVDCKESHASVEWHGVASIDRGATPRVRALDAPAERLL